MSRRLTVLAGGGALVAEVIGGARAAGDEVQILPLVDRRDLGVEEVFRAADLPKLIWRITTFRSTHVTMVGGLRASATEREAFQRFAGAGGGQSGDAAVLKIAEKVLAMTGAKVVGAETIVPAILAAAGHIAGPDLPAVLRAPAIAALRAARIIGGLDIGQAVVAAPGRIIAAEDIAGTDALMARIAGYRADGLDADLPLILAKALKPQQGRVVDRPAIGPDTLRNAAAAGIGTIVVEAGGAVVIDRAAVERLAAELGISVVGLSLDAG
jgi:DUF1009 family protein